MLVALGAEANYFKIDKVGDSYLVVEYSDDDQVLNTQFFKSKEEATKAFEENVKGLTNVIEANEKMLVEYEKVLKELKGNNGNSK